MPHLAVVGAGIGGLAAALSLAQAGCRVCLVERSDRPAETGAGLQLSPNAVAVLRGLGVLGAVERQAVLLSSLAIGRGRDAVVLARLPLARTAQDRYGEPFLVSLRADLHGALLAAVADCAAIQLETGCSLSGWSETPEGLRLAFATGAGPDVVVDGLVGADGLHSAVRGRLHPSEPALYGGRTAWRTLIDTALLPDRFSEPCSNLWLATRAHLVHYPVAAGLKINVVAVVEDRAEDPHLRGGWSSPGDPAVIRRRFSNWSPRLTELIDAASAWTRWPLADRAPLPRWSHGAVTLLGDAAHPMLPFLAQGAAQALEDAAALGDAVKREDSLPKAFIRYETARRARTSRVQSESRRQATIYHLGGPSPLARDLLLSTMPNGRLLARYDWLYGHRA